MKDFAGKTAVITGAGSGFGREFARIGAQLGMKLVLADVQPDALQGVVDELKAQGADVIGRQVDVSQAGQVQALADLAFDRHGEVHLLFNNAGVAVGGLVWENTERDWQWAMGVNLWGVIHGVKSFVPRMLAQGGEAHVVNTASVAGLVTPQMSAVYNVTKHGVVALSETLFHDLRLVGSSMGVTVLCPAYVATGIGHSERNRPADAANEAPPTESQQAAQSAMNKALQSGRLSAADVGRMTFDAIRDGRFYLLTHPRILDTVKLRMEDILALRNPSDPFSFKQDLRVKV